MPILPVRPFKANTSNITMLNQIRKLAGTDYQRRIPEATKANIKQTIDSLWTGRNFGARNEALDALVNQIGLMIHQNNSWSNKLGVFKRGMLAYGDSIEETQIGLVPSYAYDPDRDELERAVFGQATPNVQASIHKINRQEYYKITINEAMLRRAFLVDNGLATFISQLMEAPTTSDNLDEFNLMCNLFTQYYDAEGFFNVNVPDVSNVNSTEANAKALLRAVRSMTESLTFHTPYYNASGMHAHADISKMVVFLTPEVKAAIDVNALAAAFNLSHAELEPRVITIPAENMPGTGTQAILTTEDFFVVADTLYETRNIENPAGLYSNYFLHHHQILSVSRFVPAVRFSLDPDTEIGSLSETVQSVATPSVNILNDNGTAVTAATNLTRGDVYQVLATGMVLPGDPATPSTPIAGGDVMLSLEGNESTFTRITNTGTLVVSLDEASDELVITATSVQDETKSATVTKVVEGDRAQMWPDPEVIPDAGE